MIATIDFEGSSCHGYPIEVGVAFWQPGTAVIRTWSALIRPLREWLDDEFSWDPNAEQVHGLDRTALLAGGMVVTAVAERLNQLLGGSVAYCDGGEIDTAFAARLHATANIEALWRLGSMSDMVRLGCDGVRSARTVLSRIYNDDAELVHRSGPDALRLARELASESMDLLEVVPIGD